MAIIIIIIFGLLAIASFIFITMAWWKIFKKAGYSGAMFILMFIPIANIITFFIFAYGKWPILRELESYRYQLGLSGLSIPSATLPATNQRAIGETIIEDQSSAQTVVSRQLNNIEKEGEEIKEINCTKCGRKLKNIYRFCPKCGIKLANSEKELVDS